MHFPTDRTAHTMAFDEPVVDHWLERKIAQWKTSTEEDMDLKSEDLLQVEGKTEIKSESNVSNLIDEVQILKDDHLDSTSNNPTLLSTAETGDTLSKITSAQIDDTSSKVATAEESLVGDVYNDGMKFEKDKIDSFTENESVSSGGGGGDANSDLHSKIVEDIGSFASQTFETEPSIFEKINEKKSDENLNNHTVIEHEQEISDESTTDVNIQSGSKENSKSDFIDNMTAAEEISTETSNVVIENSERVMDQELKSDEVVEGDQKVTNFNTEAMSPDSGIQSVSVNGVNESEEAKSDESQITEDSCTESAQNEDVKDTKADDPEPVEEYMDILGNGLLKKKVLKAGEGRPSRPNHGETVFLSTEGHLEDGTIIDHFESASFILGDGDVIQAWDLAVPLMEMGEKCELITDSKYAYGSLGSDNVPGSATITYTLELIKKEPGLDLDSLSVQERTQKGEAKRERGNHLFSRKDYQAAINSYSKALKILEHSASTHNVDPAALKSLCDSQVKCYNNLAACQLKIEAFDAAIKSSNKVLASEPENVKALFRIGKSYGCKGDCENAEPFLRKALALDPQSKMLHRELAWVTRKMKQDNASQKEMYRRMMGADKNTPKKKLSKWWKMPLIVGSVVAGTLAILGAVYRTSQH